MAEIRVRQPSLRSQVTFQYGIKPIGDGWSMSRSQMKEAVMKMNETMNRKRARKETVASPRLDEHDAALVKGMLARGDRQHDIAAWFGVNGGRIAEIATGATFTWVMPIYDDLPPPGPYPTGKQVIEMQKALDDVRAALTVAEGRLKGLTRQTL